jgi:hypothetical protein
MLQSCLCVLGDCYLYMLLFLENVLVIRVFRQHGTMGIIGDNIIFFKNLLFRIIASKDMGLVWRHLRLLAS